MSAKKNTIVIVIVMQFKYTDDTNVLAFWKDNKENYPALARLSSIYLAIPASSAPVGFSAFLKKYLEQSVVL